MKQRYGFIIMLITMMLLFLSSVVIAETAVIERTIEQRIREIEDIQRSGGTEAVTNLRDIALNDPTVSVRKRALFALGLVTRQDTLGNVRTFLKQMALEEENRILRSAALANMDILKKRFPEEEKGSIEIQLKGDIKKGATLTFISQLSTTVDVERARAGIRRIHPNLTLLSGHTLWKGSLKANEAKEHTYDIALNKTGKYALVFFLKLDLGTRVDYQEIKKKVLFEVLEDGGRIIQPSDPDYPEDIRHMIKVKKAGDGR